MKGGVFMKVTTQQRKEIMSIVNDIDQNKLKNLSQADRKTLSFIVQNKTFKDNPESLTSKVELLKKRIGEIKQLGTPEPSGKSSIKGLKQLFGVRVASKTLHNQIKKQTGKLSIEPQDSLDTTQMISTLKQLPEGHKTSRQFVYNTKKEIEKNSGAFCLTPSKDDTSYVGFVISNDRQKGSLNILHICPGGGNLSFTNEEINEMMPTVAKELQKRNIVPDRFVIDGRHPGDTLKNFQEWQKS